MDEEALIPIVMFISVAVTFVFWFYFRYRSRMETQQTFRMALEKGSELSPDFIKQLGEPEPDKNRDLRRSLIWLSLAVGLVLIGFAVPEPDALRGLLAGAALPFSIGCAYMIMYRYGTKQES
jgi:Na+/H+ antiporter NhaD/arsenite permease-like protein